jgi:hypothetical protein
MIRTTSFLGDVPLFEDAACATIENPDLFFPEKKTEEVKNLPALRSICGSCIERKECLEYAIKERIPEGFWGGKTAAERDQMLKEQEQKTNQVANIVKLRSQGVSTEQIAKEVGLRVTLVYKILASVNKARKREDQSNQRINIREDASPSSLPLAQ